MSEDSRASTGEATQVNSLDEVFSILGDETRIEILLELAAVASDQGIGEGLGFAALRERVGVTDSGRFNYHLGRLTGQFVTKREDSYIARWPALMLVAAIRAGQYEDTDLTTERATTEFTCHLCDRALEVRFESGTLGTGVLMSCPEHGEMDGYWFPPGVRSGRSVREAMRVAYTRLLENVRLARRGICMECWGRVSTDYVLDKPDTEGDPQLEDQIFVQFACERCWNQLGVPVRTYVGTYPVVAAAFRERGYRPLDATDAMTGERGITCEDRLVREEPTGVSVRIGFDDETLVLTLDEGCSVVDHEWC